MSSLLPLKGRGLCSVLQPALIGTHSWLWNLDGPLVAGSSAGLQSPLSVSVGCRSNWWISFACLNFLWEAFWGHFVLRSLCLNITSQSAVSLTHFLGDSSTLFLTFHSSFEDLPCCKERGNRCAPAARSVALNWFRHHTKPWAKRAARGGKKENS